MRGDFDANRYRTPSFDAFAQDTLTLPTPARAESIRMSIYIYIVVIVAYLVNLGALIG
jgi:hypothetical protein